MQLSNTQKQQLFHDGYLIIRDAVPFEVSQRARERITAALPEDERKLLVAADLATHPDVLSLFRDSTMAGILRDEMGPFPDVVSCQVAVTPAFDTLGGSPGAHVDGGWSGDIPASADDIDAQTGRPRDAAKYFGEHDERRGTNDGILWQDPDRTISNGSYTALVGVALNDQTVPGNGQLGVMRGLHEDVQAAFCRQREAGTVIGAEGLDWPRIKEDLVGRLGERR
jgi:hypothetical protein